MTDLGHHLTSGYAIRRGGGTIITTPTTDRPLAVVTGASSGIGYELAVQFAEHGFDLVVVADDDGISSAAEKLRRAAQRVEGHRRHGHRVAAGPDRHRLLRAGRDGGHPGRFG
ncbi:SDR family NAD(P)-dependent oxidoreductase [Micromonospora sp. NPDC002411]